MIGQETLAVEAEKVQSYARSRAVAHTVIEREWSCKTSSGISITLRLGDAFEIASEVKAGTIDAIITDPPYVIATGGNGMAARIKCLKELAEKDMDGGFDFDRLKARFLPLLRSSNLIIFSGKQQLKQYMDWIYEAGLTWQLISWNKSNPVPMTNNNYLPDTEYIFHVWSSRVLTGDYSTKRKFYVTNIGKTAVGHPAAKPISIMKNMVLNSTQQGDVVLDPFMGSGSTGVAAVQLGRNFIGYEIDQRYFELAKKRIKGELSQERWETDFRIEEPDTRVSEETDSRAKEVVKNDERRRTTV